MLWFIIARIVRINKKWLIIKNKWMSKNWTNNTSIVFSVAIFFFALLKSNKTWHKVYSIIAHTHPIYHDINLLFCCCCCYLKPINKLKHFKSLYDKSHRSYVRAKKKIALPFACKFFLCFLLFIIKCPSGTSKSHTPTKL